MVGSESRGGDADDRAYYENGELVAKVGSVEPRPTAANDGTIISVSSRLVWLIIGRGLVLQYANAETSLQIPCRRVQ